MQPAQTIPLHQTKSWPETSNASNPSNQGFEDRGNEVIAHPPQQNGVVAGGKLPEPVYEGSTDATIFPEERKGWRGYIEWEKYPKIKEKAAKLLARYKFQTPPEFQFQPLPQTNPVLEGLRFKQYHYALGKSLKDIPEISWEYVLKEKSPDMIHILQFPYNGEPPHARLVKNAITSNEDFFVRNHGGIPEIDEDAYFFDIGGLVNEPKRLTLEELRNEELFPRQSTVVTIQCSGTRRIEQINEYAGDGDELVNAPWSEGAIGNARWTGVSLKKVIKYCGGLKEGAKHLEFIGCDSYFKKGHVFNYAVSVPWRKVKSHEVLLAWEMNGKPLPRIHGYPLRTIVTGYIGARSCKWLYAIIALREPSNGPVQRKEYLYYTPQIGKHNAKYSNGHSINEMPVSSAIMTPEASAQIIHSGEIHLTGWAYSGGGHWPVRVEVSGDGGNIWYAVPHQNLSKKYFHAWRTWTFDLPVDAEGWLDLCVRTWDNANNTQPTFVRSAWNWDLHVTSSCHRIKIYSINKSRFETAKRLAEFESRGEPFLPVTKATGFEVESDEDYQRAMDAMGGRDPEE